MKITRKTETIHGEWFTPHVIEPAFGIDRIIWHIIDHSYEEIDRDEKQYTILRTKNDVSPIKVAIFPLFEKDGMGDLAKGIKSKLTQLGTACYYDGSGSIGRRYARADEVGVPMAVTVDHQSIQDSSVTVRDRDTQKQTRVKIDELHGIIR